MENGSVKKMELKKLGSRIKELRVKCKLSQDDLGFELGFQGGSTVSNYELGSREISITGLYALARVFSEHLGDHTHYLLMGHLSDAPESIRSSDSNYVSKTVAIDELNKLIPFLISGRDIRLGKNLKASQFIRLICKKAFSVDEEIDNIRSSSS